MPDLTEILAGMFEKHQSELASVDERPDGSMVAAEAKLPRDILRFGALLRVHSYARSDGARPLCDVLEPLRDHAKDKEIVLVGVQALAKGTEEQMEDRHAHLAEGPVFAQVAKRIALLYPERQLITPLLQLLTGILVTGKPNLALHTTSCAIILWTALDIATEWSATSWEQVLTGVSVVAEMPNGKELLERYEVMECLEDAWDDLGESDEDFARLIVTEYMMDTQQVLALFTDEDSNAAGAKDDPSESDPDTCSPDDSPLMPRKVSFSCDTRFGSKRLEQLAE